MVVVVAPEVMRAVVGCSRKTLAVVVANTIYHSDVGTNGGNNYEVVVAAVRSA